MTAPAPVWRPIGRNPYGEAVEENPQGHRRIATERGWQPEENSPPWRAVRAVDAEGAGVIMASLADPWVSAGFEHSLRRAYIACRLAKGQPWSAVPADWGTSGDSRWTAFEKGVTRARGQRTLRAWLRRRPLAPDVPKWDAAARAPGATAVRGLQWGLAHRIEALSRANPAWVFHEAGLMEAADSATARLPGIRRRATAVRTGQAWAAAAVPCPTWPPLPGRSAGFGKKIKTDTGWSPHVCPVFWALPPSLAALGSLEAWWPVLAAQPQGLVVFPSMPGNQSRPLAAALARHGRTPGRWRVEQQAEIWAWGVREERWDEALTLEAWSQPVDAPTRIAETSGGDERVPYRPLSRVGPAEGVAGAALEASMRAALLDFERAHPGMDVDTWVAEGWGRSPVALGEALSAEQVDAVALARQSLESGDGFLLSDETGFGKGRVLAALALTGLAQGHTVVFITENSDLFSDFYRDLCAVAAGPLPIPTLLHQAATVFDPNGKKVARSLKAQPFKDLLKRREWKPDESRLIFTTYAQLARSRDDQKLRWLKDRLGRGEGWVLLDEAHNGAGDSNVSRRLEELVTNCGGVVYGSATFAKGETNLAFYKPVLSLPPQAMRLLKLALAGDDGRLREALTQQMARSGRLVRREHAPVDPPLPELVPFTEDRAAAVEAFSEAWREVFQATRAFAQMQEVREGVWLYLGAALSRSVREFSLQLKVDALVALVAATVAENKKAVIVVDSTLEAALRAALTPEAVETSDADSDAAWEDDGAEEGPAAAPPQMLRAGVGVPPLWRDRLVALLESVCPSRAWQSRGTDAAQATGDAHATALAAIARLPAWDLAPIDRARRALDAHGVRAGELSGRQTRLMVEPNGWRVVPRNEPDRTAVVRDFNEGRIDALFVTRAGCAGISLHAGRAFADQRVRRLIEWDIAPNPVNRVQFLGRVRRKDQVVEPEFRGLLLDTPEDRRIAEREDRKRQMLAAHLGTAPASRVGWLSELGEAVVAEWALERPDSAFLIGVSRPLPDQPVGRVDRALVRSLVLPKTERAGLLARLERGVALGAPAHALARRDRAMSSSRALRRVWWWGDPDASTADPAKALNALRLDLVERIWRPEPGAGPEEVAQALRVARANGRSGAQALADWKAAWNAEHRTGVRTTAFRLTVGQWAAARLPALDVGRAVIFRHPGTQRVARGLVLGWSTPSAAGWSGGASAWAPSQVALDVWAAGDAAPLRLSVAELMRDRHFQDGGKAAPSAWFDLPPIPERGLSMEGHPVQAAAWGQRWGLGRSALVRDVDEGPQVVWLLPAGCTWEEAMQMPRDLVDVTHALLFWRTHPDEPLAAALPRGQQLTATPVEGGLRLAFDAPTLRTAAETWLHHGLERRLRLQPLTGDPRWLTSVVAWKHVPPILHALAAAGVGWRVPSSFHAWHARTSAERTRARSG